jgi:riboflavin synthase
MFTGIIRHVGTVRAGRPGPGASRLTVDVGPLADGLALGDSVGVSGACLTACEIDAAAVAFDVVAETLSRSTLGQVRSGDRVNLERPLRLSDRLDGHLVQGHVDGVAEVRRIERAAAQWTVEFAAATALTTEMVEKGSVALDGVSLTLTHVGEGTFGVVLVPTTWSATTLGELAVGSRVNVETDLIGKYVRRCLEQAAGRSAPGAPDAQGGLTLEKLRRAGFA